MKSHDTQILKICTDVTIQVFWNIMSCRLINSDTSKNSNTLFLSLFGHLHRQNEGTTILPKIIIYQSRGRSIQDDFRLEHRCCQNLKFCPHRHRCFVGTDANSGPILLHIICFFLQEIMNRDSCDTQFNAFSMQHTQRITV